MLGVVYYEYCIFVTLSVIMMIVITLSVVAPNHDPKKVYFNCFRFHLKNKKWKKCIFFLKGDCIFILSLADIS